MCIRDRVNLALLYGEVSRLPVYFRKLTGNTADVSLIRNLMLDIAFLDMKKLSFVMGRGFYSEKMCIRDRPSTA